MRKVQKKQAQDFTAVLSEAHGEIRNVLLQENIVTAIDLIGQCQEGAVELGNFIEGIEVEGTVTVSLLEEYCEVVYQIYAKLNAGEAVDALDAYDVLEGSLRYIKKSIDNDIPVRKEVVFLPYKASMWDSLESVWKAADEDPECDAYVIPIPYYDKNPDGSFKEMHYEADQYPDYVPITSYQKYDLEANRPDMIFIHNPYDDSNYITSVEPFFYSSNLKLYTDNLVYIPYFVLGEIKPDNKASVEGMAHFCTVPGVIHAHKVIVQSEDMRQIYVDVMTEACGEHTRSYWEEKILGLGSPKFDKVASTDRENINIPEDWLRIIQKLDGSRKKIIFYNTSVTALLKHNEKMLEKMKDVFRTFKENKDDVALLWRPHPLIKATLESMRPALWEEYERILNQYKVEGWGIYDDTAELDRAVGLCDAYYGDSSSVVELVRKAGKPVMVQDVSVSFDD